MTTILVTIEQAPGELRAFPRRTREALILAARRTILIDGHRWVQWSIRGGGAGVVPRAVASSEELKRSKGKTSQVWRKVLRKLVKVVGRISGKSKPAVRTGRPPDKRPPAKGPGGYRVPIDTGDYAGSWIAEPTETGAMLYSGASPAIKAGVIEKGRRPGRGIPIPPLKDWVRRKLGIKDPDEAEGIAVRISWAAKRHGRAGLNVLGRAHPKIAEAMVRNAVQQLRVSHAKAAELYKARVKVQ